MIESFQIVENADDWKLTDNKKLDKLKLIKNLATFSKHLNLKILKNVTQKLSNNFTFLGHSLTW